MSKRTFIYNDLTFEDPGDAYSNEAVRQHLASQYYPELSQCDIKVDAEKDGTIPVRFVKRVTTKSGGQHGMRLLQRLQTASFPAVPVAEIQHPLYAQLGDSPTVAAVLDTANAAVIDDYLAQLDRMMDRPPVHFEVKQWHNKLAPSIGPIPIGF